MSNFSLNPAFLKDFPFDKYGPNFTFIVNGKKYRTSRLIADLLSPIIRNNHYNDESNNELIIDIQQKSIQNDYFLDFLQLATFQEYHIDTKQREIYSEYFLQLGNVNEYLRLQSYHSNKPSETESIEIIKKLSNSKFSEQIDHKNGQIQHHIENISKHFSQISKNELENIKIEFLEEIIKNDKLKLQSEDELFEYIIEKYEEDRAYGRLFEYVIFSNVSEKMMTKFIEKFHLEDINLCIWKSICSKIVPSFITTFDQENRYKGKVFKYIQGNEFNGIMKYLTNKTGGNIHDNGTIEITSNSMSDETDRHPKNVVDYDNDNDYDPISQVPDPFVCFDFKDRLVQLSCYSIRSAAQRPLKNWNLEVSNDGEKWKIVDRHENDPSLNAKYKVSNFKISPEINEFYRFVRIHETGYCWNRNSYDGDFTMVEFFGKLRQQKTKK